MIHDSKEIDVKLEGLDLWSIAHGEVNNEVMRRLSVQESEIQRSARSFGHPGRHHVKVEWKATYARCAREFLSETMPKLWRLGKPENVRCVYYFDS